jgi:FkbM family methyltransferase
MFIPHGSCFWLSLLLSLSLIDNWNQGVVGEGADAEVNSTLLSSKWAPINCESGFYNDYIAKYVEDDPNQGEMFARWTTTNPPFFISVHNFHYDRLRKVVYETGKYYEDDIISIFIEILRDAPPNHRVVDVGGNIGWFSLLSASLGFHVDVMEPNVANVLRLCESKRLNHWTTIETEKDIVQRTTKQSSIHIRQYGVGPNSSSSILYLGKNPGKATLLRKMLPTKKRNDIRIRERAITIIALDDMAKDLGWFDLNATIALLKVDVEGYEPSVFQGAKRLLNSGLVENVVMEITSQHDNSENKKMLDLLAQAGYYPYCIRKERFTDRAAAILSAEKANFSSDFLAQYAYRPSSQVNVWWKRK